MKINIWIDKNEKSHLLTYATQSQPQYMLHPQN